MKETYDSRWVNPQETEAAHQLMSIGEAPWIDWKHETDPVEGEDQSQVVLALCRKYGWSTESVQLRAVYLRDAQRYVVVSLWWGPRSQFLEMTAELGEPRRPPNRIGSGNRRVSTTKPLAIGHGHRFTLRGFLRSLHMG